MEPVATNLIFFDVSHLHTSAEAFNSRLKKRGVRVSILGNIRLRAVTHLDVSREQIQEALAIIREVAHEIS